jgi:hypothetical protein
MGTSPTKPLSIILPNRTLTSHRSGKTLPAGRRLASDNESVVWVVISLIVDLGTVDIPRVGFLSSTIRLIDRRNFFKTLLGKD